MTFELTKELIKSYHNHAVPLWAIEQILTTIDTVKHLKKLWRNEEDLRNKYQIIVARLEKRIGEIENDIAFYEEDGNPSKYFHYRTSQTELRELKQLYKGDTNI